VDVPFTELQTRPHCPQFCALVAVLVSQPLDTERSQSEKPLLQDPMAHVVPTHAGVPFGVEHTLPHAPQASGLFVSVVSQPSVTTALQLPKPDPQVI
jgi:hypothetical protein